MATGASQKPPTGTVRSQPARSEPVSESPKIPPESGQRGQGDG